MIKTCFDIDGTLVKPFTADFYEGAIERISLIPTKKIYLVTNQPDATADMWRETTTAVYGPPYETVCARILKIGELIDKEFEAHVSIACPPTLSPTGRWIEPSQVVSPYANIIFYPRRDARKPSAKMLEAITGRKVFVGDLETDFLAAVAAGCEFYYADEYFKRHAYN